MNIALGTRHLPAAFLLTGIAWLAGAGGLARADAAPEPLSAFPQSLLEIRTAAGNVHHFNVWIADRPARQEQGLMFVRELPEHRGMLFVYGRDRQIAMWMKNTLIPLDMLFIRADGRIAHIAERATPQSLAIITTPEPARAVLELAGGSAEALGLKAGDQVYCDLLPQPAKVRRR